MMQYSPDRNNNSSAKSLTYSAALVGFTSGVTVVIVLLWGIRYELRLLIVFGIATLAAFVAPRESLRQSPGMLSVASLGGFALGSLLGAAVSWLPYASISWLLMQVIAILLLWRNQRIKSHQ